MRIATRKPKFEFLISCFAFVVLLFAPSTRAQTYTAVTGTITDPNGLPYSFATINIQLAPAPTGPARCGNNNLQILGTTDADKNGTFQMALCPNASITPAGSQWQFNVSISPGIPLPGGTGPQTCTPTLITIAGASQSVSAAISANCPALSNITGGASSFPVTTSVAVNSGGNININTGGAITVNNGGSITPTVGSTASIISTNETNYANSVNPTAPQFGAKYNAHFNAAPSFTNTSNIVTCSGCNFTGTDNLGRPIASVGQVFFGSNTTTDVSQVTSTFITPECGIQSIDSATQIHMGVIGSLGTACNATASTTASGFAFWGTLDSNTSAGGTQTAANDPIFGAWTAAATNCIPYHHPAGVTLIERQEWTTYPSTSGSCGGQDSLTVTRQGFTITGEGSNASIVIVTPNFNPTNECIGPNGAGTGCFIALPNPVLHDWQIWGGGNSAGGLSGKSAVLIVGISPGINFEIDRMQMNGYGAATAGFIGLNIGNGTASGVSGGSIHKTNVEAFGYYTCYINPGVGASFTSTIYADSLWCTAGAQTATVNTGIFDSVNGLYGYVATTFSQTGGINGGGLGASFTCQGGAFCRSSNDNFPYTSTNTTSSAQYECLGASSATQCNISNGTIVQVVTNGNGIILVANSATGANAPVLQISETWDNAFYPIALNCASGACRYNSLGGSIYTATSSGPGSLTGASFWVSPTDTFTGFTTTIQAALTGTGTCSTLSSETSITTTGVVTCTGTLGAATLVITPLFVAPHGWYCAASDETTAADTFKQTASTTTTCTVSAAAVAQNDVVTFNTVPY
jgi:hypothetical protein